MLSDPRKYPEFGRQLFTVEVILGQGRQLGAEAQQANLPSNGKVCPLVLKGSSGRCCPVSMAVIK